MADVDIPSLQLSVLEPLLKGSVTNTSGSLALKAEVRSGNNNAPVVTGTVDIKDMAATAAATKVHYTLSSGRIKIDKNRAVLDQTTILDQENNRATLNASADLRNFSNISYSARLIPDNMLALNTGSRDNELFYGKVYTSGTIDLKGDRLGLYIDAVATTDDNSHLTMPLGGK